MKANWNNLWRMETYNFDHFCRDHAWNNCQHGNHCLHHVTLVRNLLILVAHEIKKAFNFVAQCFFAKEQTEQDDLVEVILVYLVTSVLWLDLKKFNAFQHILHGVAAVTTELQNVSDYMLLYNFSHNFIPPAQLDHFFLTLVIEDWNNFFERLLYLTHAPPELVFDLVEPIKHADKSWSWLYDFLGFSPSVYIVA